MKSKPTGPGESIIASQYNSSRDDSRASGFLLPHQQLGALALPTNPTNGQTVTLTINPFNFHVITYVTALGSTANSVLIQSTAALTAAATVNFLRRPDITNANQIAAHAPDQVYFQYVGWSLPPGGTTLTAFSLNKNVNGTSAPLTSFTIATGVTGASWTPQTMQLYIEDGVYYVGTTRVLFTGGSTPTFTAPVSNPRIDIVAVDSAGTVAVTQGTENASPVAPSYPANKAILCEVYNVVGETALYDNENQQAGQGYILNDVRNILQPVYINSSNQVASQIFIPWISSPATGDLMIYNSGWIRLPVGSTGSLLTVSAGLPAWTSSVVTAKTGAASWVTTNANGTQTIAHGLGKIPQLVQISSFFGAPSTSYFGSNGSYDGTNTTSTTLGTSAGSSPTGDTSTTYIIRYMGQEGTTESHATVTVDATNIYLAWTKVGSPNITFPFIWTVIG